MKRYALFPLITLALSACGGGEGGSSESNTQATALSAVEGKIEHVTNDTITVNGRQYQVGGVNYQGQTLSNDALAPEMLVAMASSQKQSRAATKGFTVELDPTFTGTIKDIDRPNSEFTLFTVGGLITLNYPYLDSQIRLNDRVMVSALPTANAGYKVLSVIKFENEFNKLAEAEGRISEINLNAYTFKLGQSLTVNFDPRLVNNMKKVRVGAWVEVVGGYDENNASITATKVIVKNFALGRGETEGIITWVADDHQQFELNYRGIFDIHPSTKFDCDDDQICNEYSLREGMEVEVEFVNTPKQTQAKEIEFEDADDLWNEFEISGFVSDYADDSNAFVLYNTEDYEELTIHTDAYTEYDDGLDFDNLLNQDIEVEGVIVDGKFIAQEIEREDD